MDQNIDSVNPMFTLIGVEFVMELMVFIGYITIFIENNKKQIEEKRQINMLVESIKEQRSKTE